MQIIVTDQDVAERRAVPVVVRRGLVIDQNRWATGGDVFVRQRLGNTIDETEMFAAEAVLIGSEVKLQSMHDFDVRGSRAPARPRQPTR